MKILISVPFILALWPLIVVGFAVRMVVGFCNIGWRGAEEFLDWVAR